MLSDRGLPWISGPRTERFRLMSPVYLGAPGQGVTPNRQNASCRWGPSREGVRALGPVTYSPLECRASKKGPQKRHVPQVIQSHYLLVETVGSMIHPLQPYTK